MMPVSRCLAGCLGCSLTVRKGLEECSCFEASRSPSIELLIACGRGSSRQGVGCSSPGGIQSPSEHDSSSWGKNTFSNIWGKIIVMETPIETLIYILFLRQLKH